MNPVYTSHSNSATSQDWLSVSQDMRISAFALSAGCVTQDYGTFAETTTVRYASREKATAVGKKVLSQHAALFDKLSQ